MEASRPAHAADVEAILDLAVAAVAELRGERGGGLWARREARDTLTPESLAVLVAADHVHVLVGTIDDSVVGFAILEFETLRDGTLLGRLREIYVDPAARGVGVGESLIRDVVAACRRRGCDGIDALALPGQRATKNFFEASGFTARSLVMHRSLDDTAS